MKPPNPYEDEGFRAICGETLRPGGLAVTDQSLQICAFGPKAKILDVGCGAGATLKFLRHKGFEAEGLDCSRALLNQARNHGPVVKGDFHRLKWSDGYFDGVFWECTLTLAADQRAALKETARVLKPGGRLVISDIFLDDSTGHQRPGGPARPITLAQLTLMLPDFEIISRIDHSRALKELAAQILWAGSAGALDIFGFGGAGNLYLSTIFRKAGS